MDLCGGQILNNPIESRLLTPENNVPAIYLQAPEVKGEVHNLWTASAAFQIDQDPHIS